MYKVLCHICYHHHTSPISTRLINNKLIDNNVHVLLSIQFLVLKDAVDLDESVQAGNSQALDREKRDLFTVIIRATEMMTTGKRQTLATTYTSVSLN